MSTGGRSKGAACVPARPALGWAPPGDQRPAHAGRPPLQRYGGGGQRGGVDTSTVVDSSPAELAERLAALADPIRLRIVAALADGQRCVCELQARVPIAANLLSYHLRVLREAGLLAAERRGRWVDYRLDTGGFAALWAQAASAGVPLPGNRATTARPGPACEQEAR